MVVEFNWQTYEHPVVLHVFLLLVAVDVEELVASSRGAEVSHSLSSVLHHDVVLAACLKLACHHQIVVHLVNGTFCAAHCHVSQCGHLRRCHDGGEIGVSHAFHLLGEKHVFVAAVFISPERAVVHPQISGIGVVKPAASINRVPVAVLRRFPRQISRVVFK